MPRKEVDYSKAAIYKIVCRDTQIKECYVGSTTDLTRRRYFHKSTSENSNDRRYKFFLYQFIRRNGGWENFDLVKIEDFPCNNKEDLHKRERYWIETLNSSLNRAIPTRTKKEYDKHYEKEIKERRKAYYEENKKSINERVAKYREKNKEHIKARQKEYREKHAEEKSEKEKERYQQNKEAIRKRHKQNYESKKAYYSEKIECECGFMVRRTNISSHRKTGKHQKYMSLKQDEQH